jgi:hypothetical protein
MRAGLSRLAAVAALAGLVVVRPAPAGCEAASDRILLHEDFDSLRRWEPLEFPKIPRTSSYSIERGESGGSHLRAESHDSASGMLLREEFDVSRYPTLRWRWRADNVYRKGDARKKEGDDYPLRLYVLFPYDPGEASFGEKLLFGAARLLHGQYPPHSALNYIWANKDYEEKFIANAYTERSVMIVKRGPGETGSWYEEEADIREDYRKAFGEDPPARARLAIMNDSDDTGESSVAFIDFIEIRQ